MRLVHFVVTQDTKAGLKDSPKDDCGERSEGYGGHLMDDPRGLGWLQVGIIAAWESVRALARNQDRWPGTASYNELVYFPPQSTHVPSCLSHVAEEESPRDR